MATTTTKTNKPILPRGVDNRPVDSYNRAELYSGKALDFDGVNDKVDCGDFMTDNADFSVSFYVKINTWTNNKTIVSTWDNSYNGFAIALHATGLRSWVNDGATGGMVIASLSDLGTTEYHHIVLTYDYSTGTQKGYFNGHYTNQEILEDTITHSNFQIGYGNAAYTYADVNVAGVKVFNQVLTAAQVADLYNNPEKVVPTGVANTALKLWLPMQEGAGTTAYDGSGNGNHGAVSGASWLHGIGAPVAQTAVIDWNKGTNLLKYSEQIDNAVYVTGGGSGHSVTITANHGTAPDGTQTADRVQITRGSSYAELFQRTTTSMVAGEDYVLSFYAKSLSGTPTLYTAWNNVYINEVTFTSEWVRYDYLYQYATNGTGSGLNLVTWTGLPTTSTSADLLFWGVQLEKASSIGSYTPTIGTAQTSDVLLPQGLTTGRDITGVNLFENVRKQGALNLDGNSWAEVHDNASLDFGTGSFSLEAWARVKYVAQGSSYNVIMSMGLNISNAYSVGMLVNQQLEQIFIYNNTGSAESARTEGEWVHIVGTYDETSATIYVNGVQKDQDVRTAVDTTNPWVKHIGRDTTSARFYNDQIAQPRIYNRALTASEVLQNYNATKTLYI